MAERAALKTLGSSIVYNFSYQYATGWRMCVGVLCTFFMQSDSLHFDNVACVTWRLKPSATRISNICSAVVQTNTKDNISAPHHLPFAWKVQRWPVDFPHMRSLMRKTFHVMMSSWIDFGTSVCGTSACMTFVCVTSVCGTSVYGTSACVTSACGTSVCSHFLSWTRNISTEVQSSLIMTRYGEMGAGNDAQNHETRLLIEMLYDFVAWMS